MLSEDELGVIVLFVHNPPVSLGWAFEPQTRAVLAEQQLLGVELRRQLRALGRQMRQAPRGCMRARRPMARSWKPPSRICLAISSRRRTCATAWPKPWVWFGNGGFDITRKTGAALPVKVLDVSSVSPV